MKIGQKLILGFVAIATLIVVVGYISLDTSKRALQKAIGEDSVSLATEILDKIDRDIQGRIEEFQSDTRDLIIRQAVQKSNQEFEKLDDIQAYITEQDRQWTSVPAEEITPFMQQLINNELAKELAKKTQFYEERYDYKILGEIFITNKYGANLAQTGKTSDYYQADEDWWQTAKTTGLYISDAGYEESADIYSTDIGIRIIDIDGNFIGIIKVVLNIEEAIKTIKEFKTRRTSQYGKTVYFKLLTKDGKLIYSTKPYKFGDDLSGKDIFRNILKGKNGYFIEKGDEPDEGAELFAYAHSRGYSDYTGTGWILVSEHETKDIFMPIARLRKTILIISLVITSIAIVVGFFISRSISEPLTKLRDATVQISKGNLSHRLEIDSDGEIGQLACSFEKMTVDLKKTIDNLNREITRRTEVDEVLRKNERFLKDIFDAIQDGISVMDRDLNIVRVNAWMEKMYAHKMPLIGKKCYAVYQDRDSVCPWCPSVKAIEKGRTDSKIVPYPFPNHPTEWIELSSFPLKDANNTVTGVIEYVEDVTKRMRAESTLSKLNDDLEATIEELKQSNKQLHDFAHIAAHDLKTPIRGIGTLADWIATDYADKFDEHGRQQVRLLTIRAERTIKLIDGILEYSKIARHRHKEKPVDLDTLIQAVIYEAVMPENIEITVRNKLPVIICEGQYMAMAFRHLINNAVRYIDKPQGRIIIDCIEDDGFWKFSVEDNGSGIEERHFGKIFQIFEILSQRDEVESSGIGLTVAKKIVEMYGGKIWVESKPGEGSTFFFKLPGQKSDVSNMECRDSTMRCPADREAGSRADIVEAPEAIG